MNKTLFAVLAGVVCLVGLGTASEANAAGVVRHQTVVTSRPYYQSHAVKFSGGYYFAGRDHHHWGHRTWDARRRCYTYWEPSLQVYFYYDVARAGYYPCN
jgi:hypothetical protein